MWLEVFLLPPLPVVCVCACVLIDLKNETAMNSAIQEVNSAKILRELRCDSFDSWASRWEYSIANYWLQLEEILSRGPTQGVPWLLTLRSYMVINKDCGNLGWRNWISYAELVSLEISYTVTEDLQDLLELTPQKDVLFTIGDWNAKVGSQETSGVTGKFGLGVQNEAGQKLIRVLAREHTDHCKHPLPTTQEKTLHMDITRWSTSKSD